MTIAGAVGFFVLENFGDCDLETGWPKILMKIGEV